MFYDFAITIPAGTTAADPYERTLKLTKGIIHRVEVEFPAGCRGYVSLKLMRGGHQLFPTNPDGAFNTEDYIIPIDDHYALVSAPYSLKAVAWAPETNYDHVITVRIGVLRSDVLAPFMVVAKMFAQFLELLGIKPAPAEEEVLPPTPAPPPEEEIPPPPEEEEIPPPEEEVPPSPFVPPPPPPPPAPPVLAGKILDITWEKDGVIHPLGDPRPANETILHHFRVRNTGDEAYFKAGWSYYSAFGKQDIWVYSETELISPGEGVLDWQAYSGGPFHAEVKFTLFANDQKVDEKTAMVWVI